MAKDHCPGTCRKKQSIARNVKVTKVSKGKDPCKNITEKDAFDAINNDVMKEHTFVIDLSDCSGPNCKCSIDLNATPMPEDLFKTVDFEWTLIEEVKKKDEKKGEKTIDCEYSIEGTVEIAVRFVEAACKPTLVKGKTKKKAG